MATLGIDIGGSGVKGAPVDTARGELLAERQKLTGLQHELEAVSKELALFAHTYSDRPDWLMPKKLEPGQATAIGMLSDVHAGEIVRSGEIGGYNRYDLRICEIRLQRFFTRAIRMAKSWSAYRYDGSVLPLGGDLVSGTIHDELEQTNEVTTNETVLWLVPRLAEGIELWRKAFGKVHVVSAPGNHGRDSKIPRYKRRSAHNTDTLIAGLVAQQFAKVPDVTFEIPDSLDATFRVYGFDFALEHGDELARSFSGTAEIGSLGPLMRGTNRKKNALAVQGRKMDYALWGHFHQLIPVPSRGFVANGSLKGFDEYASGLKLRPEPAQQALMVCTPEHGLATQVPLQVVDRKAEGW